ncbi:hypothetical protein B0T14DRAFT_342265 [Immersiella caudata]|uniref:Uncharacterized protein n=1 Tax=Immersiella caudata TaxID=314043 RepID=A0AA39TP80_9PEZI|nr:hypothetical protein B0T14DRAFT_342265 [Immersiella caudata]
MPQSPGRRKSPTQLTLKTSQQHRKTLTIPSLGIAPLGPSQASSSSFPRSNTNLLHKHSISERPSPPHNAASLQHPHRLPRSILLRESSSFNPSQVSHRQTHFKLHTSCNYPSSSHEPSAGNFQALILDSPGIPQQGSLAL